MLCCLGVPIPICLVPIPIVYCMWVPVPLPLPMLPLTVALPGASRQQLPSIAMIYIRSLDMNPYEKCARNSKNLHKHQKHENDQRHLFLHNMREKCELGVLKSDINVAILCIQHLSRAKSSKARPRQRSLHCPAFSTADSGTFRWARREISRGQNRPNGMPWNASALPASVMPLMPPVYPAFRIGSMLYILAAAAIRSPNDMLSSPIGQYILDYEPPRGFIMPTFSMFDGSSDYLVICMYINVSIKTTKFVSVRITSNIVAF